MRKSYFVNLGMITYLWNLLVGLSGIVMRMWVPSKGFRYLSRNFRGFLNPQCAVISAKERGSSQYRIILFVINRVSAGIAELVP